MALAAETVGAERPAVRAEAPARTAPAGSLWGRFECGWLLSGATLLAVAATGIMLTEAFSRGFLGHSYFWAEESVRYLMIWAFFLAISAAGRNGMHIRTEMLVATLPAWARRLCNILASVAGLVFSLVLLFASIPQVERYYTMGMMTESTLDLPMWALFLAMPIGAVLLAIYYAGCVVRAWKGLDPFLPLPESGHAAGDDA